MKKQLLFLCFILFATKLIGQTLQYSNDYYHGANNLEVDFKIDAHQNANHLLLHKSIKCIRIKNTGEFLDSLIIQPVQHSSANSYFVFAKFNAEDGWYAIDNWGWVYKYSITGILIWSLDVSSLLPSKELKPVRIEILSNKDLIVSGAFLLPTTPSWLNSGPFYIKLSSSGNKIWDYFPDNTYLYCSSALCKELSSKKIIYTYSHDESLAEENQKSIIICRNVDDEKIWENVFDTPAYTEIFEHLYEDHSGNIICTGIYYNSGSGNVSNNSYFINKYLSNGTLAFSIDLNGCNLQVTDLDFDQNNNILLAKNDMCYNIDMVLLPEEASIQKLNGLNGQTLFTKYINTFSNLDSGAQVNQVKYDKYGNFYTAGHRAWRNLICKYDPLGNLIWSREAEVKNGTIKRMIVNTNTKHATIHYSGFSCNYINQYQNTLTGLHNGLLIDGPISCSPSKIKMCLNGVSTCVSFADTSAFLTQGATFTSCTELRVAPDQSMQENSNHSTSLLYPNPASNEIFFQLPYGEEVLSISLFSPIGQKVLIDNPKRSSIDISGIESGIYFFKIKYQSGNSAEGKVVVNHTP